MNDGFCFCGNQLDYHEIIDCITCALDARDPYTAGHSERVSDMTFKVCQLIGLKQEDVEKKDNTLCARTVFKMWKRRIFW